MSKLSDRITLNPEIRNGKPIICGTRITVLDILEVGYPDKCGDTRMPRWQPPVAVTVHSTW